MRRAVLVLCAAGVLLTGCSATPSRSDGATASAASAATPSQSRTAPQDAAAAAGRTAYAVMARHNYDVAEIDVRDGKELRYVAPGTLDGYSVNGVSALRPGHLLVTYTRGPGCTSNVLGCGPKPSTCGAEVVDVDVASGAREVVWSVGADIRLEDAAASPDGTLIAAREMPCVPSYFNAHLVVRRTSDGSTWTMGAKLARCHGLGSPTWVDGGTALLVAYAPPPRGPAYTGADGSCTSFGDAGLVVVPALTGQPGLHGRAAPAPRGCTFTSTAASRSEVYAVIACGSAGADHDLRIDGPTTLARLEPQTLAVTARTSLGRCSDGDSLAVNDAQQVLVSVYVYCSGGTRGPRPFLGTVTGGRLAVARLSTIGELAYNDLAWPAAGQ